MNNTTNTAAAIHSLTLVAIRLKAATSNKYLAHQAEDLIDRALTMVDRGNLAAARDFAEQALCVLGVTDPAAIA